MKNCKLIDINFKEIIEIFNSRGKAAASEFTRQKYGTEYYLIARRIKAETSYRYNKGTRKYELTESNNQFLTLEELCNSGSSVEKPPTALPSQLQFSPFESIVVDLMKDRISEISKYVHLEQSSKRITISIENLKKAGYEVTLN